MTLTVVIVGAGSDAVLNARLVKPKAEPPAVALNSTVVSLLSGLISKLVVEFDSTVQSILACVPFLYSAAGASCASIVPAM